MLHLNFAPSLDMLVPELLSEVRRVWTDPFSAPDILVPSPALGKWLRMRLADGKAGDADAAPFSCVANLRLPTIERYLWELIRPDGCRMLDQQHLQQVLCALLDEEVINDPVFAPIKSYLTGQSGIDPLKRVQLTGRIAHQFLEYEYNRPGVWRTTGRWDPEGIDGTWMRGKTCTGDTVNEPWQAELYRRMRACFSQPLTGENGRPVTFLTLPQLYRLRREAITPADAPLPTQIDPPEIFMFGITKVSHFHRNLFVEISQIDGVDLHVYLTNPCAEFWEDVDTSRSSYRRTWRSSMTAAAIMPRKPDDYNKPELEKLDANAPHADQKLLELWGNAGKENIFLWCQDAQWNFDYASPAWVEEEKAPATLLQSLQYSLLRRQSGLTLPTAGAVPDPTLQILACPDRGREIEEIREQILDAVHDGTGSMLNEIVVYLSDPSEYVSHIQRVFGRFSRFDPEYIPFCILGTPGKESLVAQGVSTLLELFRRRFDRTHVFELLRNPIVQAGRKVSPAMVAVWERWAAALGIFRGFNRFHREEMGDVGQTVTDAHTFEAGMVRMLLSDLTEGPSILDLRDIGAGGNGSVPMQLLPYRDFDTSDRDNLEAFCATVEALFSDGKSLRAAAEESIPRAVEVFLEIIRTWFGTIPSESTVDTAAEGAILHSLYEGIAAISLQYSAAKRSAISLGEFVGLVRSCLPEELPSRSVAWTGGVTFVPLRPSMIVPHTIIFAAGLDADSFPGSSQRPSWDLLGGKRIIGDFDAVRANRFAFLELLHAARKRLVLSFLSRNMQKEEDLHPSSVVQELETYLRGQGFTATGSDGNEYCSLRRDIPWIVHESLEALAAAGRAHGTWNRSELDMALIAAGKRVPHRHDLAGKSTARETCAADCVTHLYDIRKFFRNPLEYHLYRTLGLGEEETPVDISAADEPVDSGNLVLSRMFREIVRLVMEKIFPRDSDGELPDVENLRTFAHAEAYRLYRLHAVGGNAPEAQVEIAEMQSMLASARAVVAPALYLSRKFTDHFLLSNTPWALGREACDVDLNVTLAGGIRCAVECAHTLVLVPRVHSSGAPAGIIAVAADGAAEKNPDLWLEGALQWFAELKNAHPYRIVLVQLNYGRDKEEDTDVELLPLRSTDAGGELAGKFGAWLTHFLSEMLVSRTCDHLPFVCIQKFWNSLSMAGIRENLESEHSLYRTYLPSFALADAQLPALSDDELIERARSRYAPMLDCWLIDEKGAQF